LIIFL